MLTRKNIVRGVGVLLTTAVVVYLAVTLFTAPKRVEAKLAGQKLAEPEFAWVNEQQCGSCHQQYVQQWQRSDHAMAMAVATPDYVRGQFNTDRFYQKDQHYWLTSPAGDGQREHFPVAYTFGWQPLQQYLVATERGRWQAFGQAWDTELQQWFALYPEQANDTSHPLHWQQPLHMANTQCISCHVTNYQANYDPNTDRFNSTWQALGVGCQSCHGPAAEHVNWAKTATAEPMPEHGLKGFKVSLNQAETQLNSCAQCHSRRIELTDFSPETDVHEQFLLSPLSADLYEVDGKILEEVFEYGSFVQSNMQQAGVVCSDCHNAHSGALRAPGNAVCSQCHNPQGQAARPGLNTERLQSKDYTSSEHHFHPVDSVGAQCTSCHMPGRTYMGNDYRHDHSFSSPNPAQAAQLNHSDACLGCHQEQAPAAIIAQFQQWYPAAQARDGGYAKTLFMARQGEEGAAQALLEQLQQEQQPPIRLAALLTELANYPSSAAQQLVLRYANHSHALLRRAAIEAATALMPFAWLQGQFPRWLQDQATAVRVTAAEQLIGLQQPVAPALLMEYEQLQQRHLATAQGHFNLASVYQLTGREHQVGASLQLALQRNSNYIPAMIAWADWLEVQNPNQALQFLQQQLQRQPNSAALHFAMALSQVRQGNLALAITHLQQAYSLDPGNSQYAYVLAVATYDSGAQQQALAILRTALAINPHQRQLRLALLQYSGNSAERIKLLDDLQRINPFDPFLEITLSD